MPKKPPKGPFYFFMLEYKQRCERNGEHFPEGIRDQSLKDNAGAEWNVMPPNLKKKYEDMAKEEKAKRKNDDTQKVTNMHRTFSSIDKMRQEEEEEKAQMNSWIEQKILSLTNKSSLAEHKFYLVHMNYYCTTEGENYHPAEIGLAEFSLAEGITNVYHTILRGRIPLGYMFDAKQKAEQYHKIPVDIGEMDFNKVFLEIKKFLEPGRRYNNGMYPPMFTMADNVCLNVSTSCVKSVMKKLCLETAVVQENPDNYPIYSLEKLFYEMKVAAAELDEQSQQVTLPSMIKEVLDKDVFALSSNIACAFHKEEDCVQYCSKSYVQRWAFLMCDHCCQYLNVDLVPGRHVPVNSNTDPTRRFARQLEEKKPEPMNFTWTDHSKPQSKPYVAVEQPPLPRPTKQANLASMMGPAALETSEFDFPPISLGRGRGGFRGRGSGYGGRGGRGPEPLSFAGAMKRK